MNVLEVDDQSIYTGGKTEPTISFRNRDLTIADRSVGMQWEIIYDHNTSFYSSVKTQSCG